MIKLAKLLLGGAPPVEEFAPPLLKLQNEAPSPLPRRVLQGLLILLAVMLVWAAFGRLDEIAVAEGRLVPLTYLKVVQPAEAGIVKQLLVHEGDAVKQGQVLVRMDQHLSDADSREIGNALQVKALQLRRIDAELAGRPMKREASDPPELFAQIAEQFHERRQAYLDALAAEQAAMARAGQDLAAATQQEAKLARILPILQEQDAGWQQLVKEGFSGKLLAMDKTRARIEAEQELAAQRHAVVGLKASFEQARRKIAQINSTYRSQLQNERVEAEAQHHKLRQDNDKQLHRHELLELKAPQAGIIKDLATHTAGTVVQPGTILMTLVPVNEPMQAEVMVSNLDAGFVQPGQPARLRFVTYPFQKYGMADGKVLHVSPDAAEPNEFGKAARGSETAPVMAGYRTLVALELPYLEADGRRYRLSPGMQVAAEIHLGTRTVLEYLLSPVRRIAHEAGRER